ncbi:MAG: serine hydrolase domain-containing protein [Steroidobacteraceae bacterium]
MKALRWLLALLAMAIAIPSPAADDVIGPRQLHAALQQAVDDGSPGLSAAIADRRGVIWTGVAGWADLATHRPMDEAALFGIGSITKVFVAVVVLQLVEEGKLKLTDTPRKILGRSAVRGIANSDVATVADLLGHKAGVPSWETDPRWIRKGRGAEFDPTHHWRKTEALAYVRGTGATSPAGESFAYSNSGYTLLGLMIEKLTGRTAEAEIRRRVLAPLALTDTYLEGFEPGPAARVPHRYQYLTDKFRTDAGLAPSFAQVRSDLIDTGASNLSAEWTAGGLISSPRDLVLFARALNDGRLLKPASLAYMQQWSPGFRHMEAGHGLFRIAVGETRLVGHTGGVLGFTAVLWWNENSDTIVAVLSNGSGLHAGKTPPKATTVGLDPAFVSLAIRYARQQNAE